MKKNKVILTVLAAVMLVVTSIAGTVAYLSDTKTVVNTFTSGNVKITLDEAKTNTAGEPLDGNNVVDNVADAERTDRNTYHLLPGQSYTKDPTVTVVEKSEDAYVRMLVEVKNYDDLLAAFPKARYADFYATDGSKEVFLLEKLVTGWNSAEWAFVGVAVDNNVATYEFRYKEVVVRSEEKRKLEPLFTAINVPAKMNNDESGYIKNVEINVIGNAIQAAGFENANDAWAAFAAF